MGVKGLWKYLRTNGVKLKSVYLSRDSSKKILVCDMIAVFYWLIESVHKAKVKSGEYSIYTAIYGGDFNDYRERILGFIEALRHIDITPFFFLDGPPCASGSVSSPKHTVRILRCIKNLAQIEEYAKICNYDRKTETLTYEKKIRKMLLFSELIQALVDVDVKVIFCYGIADRYIAEYAKNNSDRVCGVLTNDTDLALMEDIPWIHYTLFDFKDALKLKTPNMVKDPLEIQCKMLTSKVIADHFRIDEKCLPALSILCGNDFTNTNDPYYDIAKQYTLGYRHAHEAPTAAAAFIRQHQIECTNSMGFLALRQLAEICNPPSVKYSYEFYQSPTPSTHVDYDSIIATKQGRKNIKCLFLSSTENGIVWRDEIEQLDKTCCCIYKTTLPVRKLMYRLSLEAPRVVIEHGQSLDTYTETRVEVIPFEPTVLSNLRGLQDKEKMFLMFYALCKHELPDGHLEVPAAFDSPVSVVLTCSCLVFARKYQIVKDDGHLTALLLACFTCAIGLKPPPTSSRPSPKGVTIAAQFMTVLQHAIWLANTIELQEPLPMPSSVFQPFAYIPFHDATFKIAQKTKFYGKDIALKQVYDSLSSKKAFKDFKTCICSEAADTVNHHCFITITGCFKRSCDLLQRNFK